MNSFHHLLLFLYILCVMLRITNIRKVKMREMEMARKKAEREQAALTDGGEAAPASETAEAASQPAENTSAGTEKQDN